MPKITWLSSYSHQALTQQVSDQGPQHSARTTASPPSPTVTWTGGNALPNSTKASPIEQFAVFRTAESQPPPRKRSLPAQTRSLPQRCCILSLSAGEAGLLRQLCTWHSPEPCTTTATTAGQQL